MRILQMVPELEAGGVETGTIDLARALKKKGHAVIVVSNGGKLVEALESNNIPHIKLPIHRKSLKSLLLVPKIERLIRSQYIDIVHASSRVPAWIGYLACKKTKTPFITSCHGFYSRHPFSSVMGRGKLVMVISDAIGERMRGAFKVPPEKIRVVYRGVNLVKYHFSEDKYDHKKDTFTVINIGRITPLKGHYEFIKAMQLVVREEPRAEAWIVGGAAKSKKPYMDRLRRLAVDLGIEKHIKFLGVKRDIPDLLKKADVLVLSSNKPEGFGRAVIEAGAVGTAVCASNIGGIKEIVKNGISGLLFPPGDEKKISECILKMLHEPEFCKTCAKSLRRRVEKDFSLERMAVDTLAAYTEALGK
jgi:glycosyltransferase involved in cell wall biosynthesis